MLVLQRNKVHIHSTIQYSTVQHSTVQYSTVQYSTVQYSTVQVCQATPTTPPPEHRRCLSSL